MTVILTIPVLIGWIILAAMLFKPGSGFMPRPYRFILLAALLMTAILFINESIHDPAKPPYTLTHAIQEAILAGSVFTGCFFLVLAGIFFLFSNAWKTLRRIHDNTNHQA